MITPEFLSTEKAKSILNPEDLDTSKFILSLYESDDIDISEAVDFLKNYVEIKSPMEEIALNYIADNFQFYKQADDTIIFGQEYDHIFCSIIETTTLGFYALLKEFFQPNVDDWQLKQVSTYIPIHNYCERKDCWESKQAQISFEWAAGSRMLAHVIHEKLNLTIKYLNHKLYRVLDDEKLALFFDEIDEEYRNDYFDGLKDRLL